MSNPELNAKKVVRPSTVPAPRSSDTAGIPTQDVGHGRPNFPSYSQPTVGGIPHASKIEDLIPAAGNGEALDIPGANRGERGQ